MAGVRARIVLIAAAALAGCATTPRVESAGQPKSLAWAQGCWAQDDAGMTLALLPDRTRGGLLSGAIVEIVDGRRQANQTLTFSHDGLQMAFGFGAQRPTDRFWRSPYRQDDVFEALRRVPIASEDREGDTPLYAVFESDLGMRIHLEGDGARLTVFRAPRGAATGETYFTGARVDCPEEELLRLDDSDA